MLLYNLFLQAYKNKANCLLNCNQIIMKLCTEYIKYEINNNNTTHSNVLVDIVQHLCCEKASTY